MRNLLAIIFGMTLASGVALADSQSMGFSELDANGDGALSETELQAADVSIADADSDGDGQVSKSEYETAAKGAMSEGESGTTE